MEHVFKLRGKRTKRFPAFIIDHDDFEAIAWIIQRGERTKAGAQLLRAIARRYDHRKFANIRHCHNIIWRLGEIPPSDEVDLSWNNWLWPRGTAAPSSRSSVCPGDQCLA